MFATLGKRCVLNFFPGCAQLYSPPQIHMCWSFYCLLSAFSFKKSFRPILVVVLCADNVTECIRSLYIRWWCFVLRFHVRKKRFFSSLIFRIHIKAQKLHQTKRLPTQIHIQSFCLFHPFIHSSIHTSIHLQKEHFFLSISLYTCIAMLRFYMLRWRKSFWIEWLLCFNERR